MHQGFHLVCEAKLEYHVFVALLETKHTDNFETVAKDTALTGRHINSLGRLMLPLVLLVVLVLFSSCSSPRQNSAVRAVVTVPQSTVSAGSTYVSNSITRADVLQIAASYATHEWRASETNIFHGFDKNGVRVDTPDTKWWGTDGWHADGRMNVGIPYCWSGAASISGFDKAVREGRPAGYSFKEDIRPRMSSLPVGVDCTGFISRCWQLNGRCATYDLIGVCRQLDSFSELRPGDAVNKPYEHAALFVGWLDQKHEKMRVLEATPPKVQEGEYETLWLGQNGYVPLRYLGIGE